jgi:hypothetical protein
VFWCDPFVCVCVVWVYVCLLCYVVLCCVMFVCLLAWLFVCLFDCFFVCLLVSLIALLMCMLSWRMVGLQNFWFLYLKKLWWIEFVLDIGRLSPVTCLSLLFRVGFWFWVYVSGLNFWLRSMLSFVFVCLVCMFGSLHQLNV